MIIDFIERIAPYAFSALLSLPVGGGSNDLLSQLREHPDCHANHHQVFGKRHEPQWNPAVTADTGALEFAFVDVDRLEHTDRADASVPK